VSIGEDGLRRAATGINVFHWIGISAMAIAALSAGLAIQPGPRPGTKACADRASRVPIEARKCLHCGYRGEEQG